TALMAVPNVGCNDGPARKQRSRAGRFHWRYAPRLGALRPTGRRRGALAGRVSAGGVSGASTSSVSTSTSSSEAATAATLGTTVTGTLRLGGGFLWPPRGAAAGRRPPPAARFFALPP